MATNKVQVTLEWKGAEALQALVSGVYEAGIDTAIEVMTEAKILVAKRSGSLGRSGAVTVNYVPPAQRIFEESGGGKRYSGVDHLRILLPKSPPRTKNIRIYLTFSAPYALQAHENMLSQTGSPKFLETPAMSFKERLLKHAPIRTQEQLKKIRLTKRF